MLENKRKVINFLHLKLSEFSSSFKLFITPFALPRMVIRNVPIRNVSVNVERKSFFAAKVALFNSLNEMLKILGKSFLIIASGDS